MDLFRVEYDKVVSVLGNEKASAMVLSTVGVDGSPSSRVVLMRRCDRKGIVFFTNFKSRKGHEISFSPNVAVNFYWAETETQIRVEGVATKIPDIESDEYYQSRHPVSRISSLYSLQSEVLESFENFESKVHDAVESLKEMPKRPKFWGGYIITPHVIEFWKNGKYRIHKRKRYTFQEGTWVSDMLYP